MSSSVIGNKAVLAKAKAKKKKEVSTRPEWDVKVPGVDGGDDVWLSETFSNPDAYKKDQAFQERAKEAVTKAYGDARKGEEDQKIAQLTGEPNPTPPPPNPVQPPPQGGQVPAQGFRNGPTAALSTGLEYSRSPQEVMARIRQGRAALETSRNVDPNQQAQAGAAAVQQGKIDQANRAAGTQGTGVFSQDKSGGLTRMGSKRNLMDNVRKKKKENATKASAGI